MVCVWSGWLRTAAHKGLPGQATEPGVSMAQGLWCHVRWCSEHEERGWWGWGSQTEQQHPPPFCPADCLLPGQILTRSLGRRASPGPFLLPSGAGTPACRRGSGPGGRQSAWPCQGCMAGARAPCLTGPSLSCRRCTTAVPGRASSLAVPTCGQESLPSGPGRQKAAGAQPTPYQGLVGHWPCATSPPSPGHGRGHGARAGGGRELLGLCSVSSILPWLGRAEQHCEHPLHHRAPSLGKGVLVPQGSRAGKGAYGLPERQCRGRGPAPWAPEVAGRELHRLTSMSCCCSLSVISLRR